jgi:two-component system nitrogen regulation sensor histidine kinase GlnL
MDFPTCDPVVGREWPVPRDLQSVLDAVLDGVLVLDAGGRVERVNAEACRILETSAESSAGTAIEKLVGEWHPLAGLARRVLDSGRSAIADELSLERRFDTDLIVDAAASPLYEDRDLNGVVIALRDRTVSNSLREIVSQRDQLTSYGHIAAGIAHEVKNPLGGIRGAAELLGRWSNEERGRKTSELIVREVDRISALVEELMVFARGDELRVEPLNLHRVLDSVIELVELEPFEGDCEIERAYDPSIPEFLGDPDRLRQVFLNLARNALQSMEEKGGRLTIETRMTLDSRLAGRDGRHVPTVQARFSDTGPGIPRDILERLATPFFTTRKKGTGLGLAVSRHWVTKHAGTLRISSEPGEGCVVRVNLPLERIPDGAASEQPEEAERGAEREFKGIS